MGSPSVDTMSISTLFTLDSPSKKGQAEAGVVVAPVFSCLGFLDRAGHTV